MERKMKRGKSRFQRMLAGGMACCMAVSLLLTGCGQNSTQSGAASTGSSSASEPKKGGTMMFGLSTEPKTLAPYVENGYAQKQIVYSIYRNLFSVNEKGETVPGLCDKYSVSSDGLTWKFHLIDATFQNGDPVTANDVKFTIEYIRDNDKLGAFLTPNFKEYIKSVTATDDKNVEIQTTKPCAVLKEWLSSYYASILSKSWTEAHDLATEPMGAGPFKFKAWERGTNITLERYDSCYEGAPNLDGIEFDFYPDEDARINALKTGVVDLIDYVSAQNFKAIESTDGIALDKADGPFMSLVLNQKYKPLDNPLVRRAIGYAVNRDDVIKMAFNEQGTAMYGVPLTKSMKAIIRNTIATLNMTPQRRKSCWHRQATRTDSN